MTSLHTTIRFQPDALGVRQALDEGMSRCRGLVPVGREDRLGNVQIVLAEALNNVAEHGFAELPLTEARLDIALNRDTLTVSICDKGHEMPGLRVPAPKHHDLNGDVQDLPEGGFGWMLIHELTSRIDYARVDDENHLTLTFVLALD
ncbi:MAG: ATP-binding protein [Paracoccaceae bacterium]